MAEGLGLIDEIFASLNADAEKKEPADEKKPEDAGKDEGKETQNEDGGEERKEDEPKGESLLFPQGDDFRRFIAEREERQQE